MEKGKIAETIKTMGALRKKLERAGEISNPFHQLEALNSAELEKFLEAIIIAEAALAKAYLDSL